MDNNPQPKPKSEIGAVGSIDHINVLLTRFPGAIITSISSVDDKLSVIIKIDETICGNSRMYSGRTFKEIGKFIKCPFEKKQISHKHNTDSVSFVAIHGLKLPYKNIPNDFSVILNGQRIEDVVYFANNLLNIGDSYPKAEFKETNQLLLTTCDGVSDFISKLTIYRDNSIEDKDIFELISSHKNQEKEIMCINTDIDGRFALLCEQQKIQKT
jgi:hypothetical protein